MGEYNENQPASEANPVPVAVVPSQYIPDPKVIGVAIGGSITAIVVWGCKQFIAVDVPGDVAAALTTLIATATGYLTSRT